jgi:hypothetical protein
MAQADLDLTSASASQELGFQVCATTPSITLKYIKTLILFM